MHNELNRIEVKTKYQEIDCDKLPIVGDDKYGDFAINKVFGANKKNTMYLHAHKLSFFHPITNKRLTLTAPIPKNFSLQFKHLVI